MRLDELDIPWGRGIFRRTKRISLELSSICNLAAQHRRCPLHAQAEPHILPERIVESVLATCRAHEFRGVVAFHMYNEPGIDPRLVHFMRLFKDALPGVRLFLLTNGWYLTQSLADELVGHGLDFLDISVYSAAEARRLAAIKLPIRVRIMRQRLDDRLEWYDQPGGSRRGRPCYCPLYELCISCRGQVCLCPYDWQRRHVFGDLNRETLDEVLRRPAIWRAYEQLAAGRRLKAVCRRCPTTRGEPFV